MEEPRQRSTVSKICGDVLVTCLTCVIVAGSAWLVGQIVAHIPH